MSGHVGPRIFRGLMIGGVFSVYYVPCYRGNSVRNELGRLCSDKMGQMFEGGLLAFLKHASGAGQVP